MIRDWVTPDPASRSKVTHDDLKKAGEFLKTVYESEAPADSNLIKLNLEHAEHVREYASLIAKPECLDGELVQLAAILHDICKLDRQIAGNIDTFSHHAKGAVLAKEFTLYRLGLSEAVAEKVFNMIVRHSAIPFIERHWIENYGVDVPRPKNAYDIALRDADIIDQLGIGGVRKIVHFRQTKRSVFFKEDGGNIQNAIASAQKSVCEAEGVICTSPGKKLACGHADNTKKFFEALEGVENLAEFDWVSDIFANSI